MDNINTMTADDHRCRAADLMEQAAQVGPGISGSDQRQAALHLDFARSIDQARIADALEARVRLAALTASQRRDITLPGDLVQLAAIGLDAD